MQFRTDRQRVQGLGASRDGVGHWWSQRLTSIALVPLTVVFLFPLVGFRHLQQGIQVVIEDYVHDKPLLVGLQLANTLLCLAFAMTGIFAVASIAFS
jgi:succinate dehydrogenase / fumarate reductase membrane anchor subunit